MTFKGEGVSVFLACFAVFAAMIMIVSHSPAEAANPTTASAISARATDETSILLKMPYTGDDNNDNTYTVEYKPCTDATYTVWVTTAPHSLSPYQTMITGLTPYTCYDIKATYNDADGVNGAVAQTIRITSTWDNTLLHNANRFPSPGKWTEAGGWGLPGTKYGKIDCSTCHTFRAPNIKGITGNISSPDGTEFPGQTAGEGVVFQSVTTPDGFGDDTGGHSGSRKICEYCHSQTTYHRHDTIGQTKLTHNNNTDCLRCHPHAEGFYYATGDCDSCHGNPPVVNTAGGPDGLANAPQTKSATAGMHSAHTAKSVACSNCHYNTIGAGVTHRDSSVTLGFYLFEGAYQGGMYDGQTAVNSYNATSTTPATTVSKNNTKTCSNIYCHGATMDPDGGTNITPAWDNPSSGACGTCHGAAASAPPAKGSHLKHAQANQNGYGYNCGLCHKDPASDNILHVNNKSEVVFSPDQKTTGGQYSGTDTMLDTYSTCTNIYCHSSVQSSPPGNAPIYRVTPTWGDNNSLGCAGCHMYAGGTYPPVTGSHEKHFQYNWGWGGECSPCHNWNQADFDDFNCAAPCHTDEGTGDPRRDMHANGAINVLFPPMFGGTYGGSSIPGDAYGNCSNTYCHSNGTGGTANSGDTRGIAANISPGWGSAGPLCGDCHGEGDTSGRPSYPNGSPKANSHVSHIYINCKTCHWPTTQTNTTITDYSKHANRLYDIGNSTISISYSYNVAGGSCSITLGCHGTAQWGTTMTLDFSNCISCHKSAMGSRRQIVDSNGDGTGTGGDFRKVSHHHYGATGTITNADCQVCHDTSQHPGGNVRLKNADTGEVYAYNPLAPATAEPHCLSCHDADGANGNMIPFSDGKTLGAGLYRAGAEIKDNWNKTYGHKQKGLTCLGNGSPNTGCHASGHGADYVGLLARNLTLPTTLEGQGAPYQSGNEGAYELCFSCHASYPGKTKEAILGVKAGSKYDWDHGWGVMPPYYIANTQTNFKDRYDASGKTYDNQEGWRVAGEYYNLHFYHLQDHNWWTGEGGWKYRGSIDSGEHCLTCHSVHGSNTQWGWVYDEMNYTHKAGSGSDQYGEMSLSDLNSLNNYPVSCAYNCHPEQGPTHNWFEPAGE